MITAVKFIRSIDLEGFEVSEIRWSKEARSIVIEGNTIRCVMPKGSPDIIIPMSNIKNWEESEVK